MNQSHFHIQNVAALAPCRLDITFGDGFAATIDLTEVIAKHPTLARLTDPYVFRKVTRDEWNRGVMFAGDEDLSLASDNLRAMAIEQAGGFSHQQLLNWMTHHNMTLDQAARELDLSRRMLAYYRSGDKPIPQTVGLAMAGWDVLAERGREHLFDYEQAA